MSALREIVQLPKISLPLRANFRHIARGAGAAPEKRAKTPHIVLTTIGNYYILMNYE